MSDSTQPEIPLWPKGSLGWYKEKIQFQIDMLDDCPAKTELQEMLDGVKKKTGWVEGLENKETSDE